jgi:hypothetical protein
MDKYKSLVVMVSLKTGCNSDKPMIQKDLSLLQYPVQPVLAADGKLWTSTTADFAELLTHNFSPVHPPGLITR